MTVADITQNTTRRQLIEQVEKGIPSGLFEKYGGVIRKMRRKQLIFVLDLIEINKGLKKKKVKKNG